LQQRGESPIPPGVNDLVTRVVLADDHQLLRHALRRLLEAENTVEVVAEVGDGREAVDAAIRLKPEVVLMDIWMPRLSGIDATRELLARDRSAKVLMLSMHEGRSFVEDALRAGAAGYVLKSAPARELFEAIAAVRDGRSYLSAAVAHEAIEAIRHPRATSSAPFDMLTGREREVLQRIAEGLGSKEIASDLHLSRRTVESHRAHLMRKLGVHKTSALVRIAIREGLVSP
jgi:DNA-binding NarL/FixJ family response regulator